eukprot:TRINITY_DN6915_c0_g1_i1.p1 TRINITY_DN6915_c0_g1~~TRINITY_DN6915_c0_g1_i1.p1  ORF type:complete len:122 (+),score=4.43 TRINITY_DN6915_c0_g1_i1:317-682(+)
MRRGRVRVICIEQILNCVKGFLVISYKILRLLVGQVGDIKWKGRKIIEQELLMGKDVNTVVMTTRVTIGEVMKGKECKKVFTCLVDRRLYIMSKGKIVVPCFPLNQRVYVHLLYLWQTAHH